MAIHKSKNFFIFLIVLVSPAKLQNSPPRQILKVKFTPDVKNSAKSFVN